MTVNSVGPSLQWWLFRSAPEKVIGALQGEGPVPEAISLEQLNSARDDFAEGTKERRYLDALTARLTGQPAGTPQRTAHTEFQFEGMRGRRRQQDVHAASSPGQPPSVPLRLQRELESVLAAAAEGQQPTTAELEKLVASAITSGGELGLLELLKRADGEARGAWKLGVAPADAMRAAVRELARATLAWRHLSGPAPSRTEAGAAMRVAAEAIRLVGGFPAEGRRRGGFHGEARPPGLPALLPKLSGRGGAVVGGTEATLELAVAAEAELAVIVSSESTGRCATGQLLVATLLAIDELGNELDWSPEQRVEELKKRLTGNTGRVLRAELPLSGLDGTLRTHVSEGRPGLFRRDEYAAAALWLNGPDAPQALAHLTRMAKEGRLVFVQANWGDAGIAEGINAILDAYGTKVSLLELANMLDVPDVMGPKGQPLQTVAALHTREEAEVLTFLGPFQETARAVASALEGQSKGILKIPLTDEEYAIVAGATETLSLLGTPEAPALLTPQELVSTDGLGPQMLKIQRSLPSVRQQLWECELTVARYNSWQPSRSSAPEDERSFDAALKEARLETSTFGTPDLRRAVQHYALTFGTESYSEYADHTALMKTLGKIYTHANPFFFPYRWTEEDVQKLEALPWPVPDRPEDVPAAATEFLRAHFTEERKVALLNRLWTVQNLSEGAQSFVLELARTAEFPEGLSKLVELVALVSLKDEKGRSKRGWSDADAAHAVRLVFDCSLDEPGVAPPDLIDRLESLHTQDDAANLLCYIGEHLGRTPRITAFEAPSRPKIRL